MRWCYFDVQTKLTKIDNVFLDFHAESGLNSTYELAEIALNIPWSTLLLNKFRGNSKRD